MIQEPKEPWLPVQCFGALTRVNNHEAAKQMTAHMPSQFIDPQFFRAYQCQDCHNFVFVANHADVAKSWAHGHTKKTWD